MAVDESAKLDVLEAIGRALGLEGKGPWNTPEEVRPAAEALLTVSEDIWNQATLVREEEMGEGTLAGLHPVLRSIIGMDRIVWDTIGRMRPKYRTAIEERNATAGEFILKATSVALASRDSVPVHPSLGVKQRLSLGEAEEQDARDASGAFYRNYLRYRPAHLRTQADVAEAAGLSVGTIATIEKMKAKPHHSTVSKLAKAFGVTVEQMLRAG
jgi:DNA-binding XRE family transcriptional regulator